MLGDLILAHQGRDALLKNAPSKLPHPNVFARSCEMTGAETLVGFLSGLSLYVGEAGFVFWYGGLLKAIGGCRELVLVPGEVSLPSLRMISLRMSSVYTHCPCRAQQSPAAV